MFVAEAPGREEDELGSTLVGAAGQEFDRMLADAGLDRADVFCTNICKYRPPANNLAEYFLDRDKKGRPVKKPKMPGPLIVEGLKELAQEIEQVNPEVIVPMGNFALRTFTSQWGITTWRGSQMPPSPWAPFGLTKLDFAVVPTIHPASILRQWNQRWYCVQDLRRAAKQGRRVVPPLWRFRVAPTFNEAKESLQLLIQLAKLGKPIVADIETRAGHVACIGFAWSKLDAVCIPFLDVTKNQFAYWTKEQEAEILVLLRTLFLCPALKLVGQNFLYDLQYLSKFWGVAPKVWHDTLLAQHVCFPGTKKGLDFLSSVLCEFHQYWKDDGKNFDPFKDDQVQLWVYCCRDCVATFEVMEEQTSMLDQLNRRPQFEWQQNKLYPVVLGMMLRGVDVNTKLRGELAMEIQSHVAERQKLINYYAKRELNPRSPQQLQELFYHEFKQKPILDLKTKRPTTNDDAMEEIAKREPLLRQLCYAINETRSLGSAMNVVMSGLDTDGKMRTSYNIGGTKTFRFSSSENAFGGGGNLQNITEGKTSEFTGLKLPNLRRLIVPPPDHYFAEPDLDKADLYVVVWEAEDEGLKIALRSGLDMHLYNARDVFNLDIPDNEIIDGTEVCEEHKRRYKPQRQLCKIAVHATDYGAREWKLARVLGKSVHEASQFQQRWFSVHPGIKKWQTRVENQLNETRSVSNRFGYVCHFFDRMEDCFTDALAWTPQSTVGIVINHIMVRIDEVFKPKVQVRLQTHDATGFTYHKSLHPTVLQEIKPHTRIVVPYDDPLVIPMTFKASPISWGDCKQISLG